MKVLLYLVLLSQIILAQGVKVISNQEFNKIVSISLIKKQIWVFSGKGDYHVKLYDIEKDKVIRQLIRDGNGPLEAKTIDCGIYDPQTKCLFLKKSGGGLLKITTEGQLIRNSSDIVISTILRTNNLQFYEDEIILSCMSELDIKNHQNNSYLTVGYVLSQTTLNIKKEIKIPIELLNFDESVNKLKSIMISSNIFRTSANEYTIFIQGINKIITYNFIKNKFLDVELDISSFFKIRAKKNALYNIWGAQYCAINNSCFMSEDKIYSFYGNKHQGIDFGYFEYDFRKKYIKKISLNESDLEEIIEPKGYIFSSKLYLIDNFFENAYTIFFKTL